MAVILNIPMPSSCDDCPFKKNYHTNDYGSHCNCQFDDEYRTIDLLLHKKPDLCPLKEVN